MTTVKSKESKKLIPSCMFEECYIDGFKKQDIIQQYPTRRHGAYYLDKFINYLNDKHQLSLRDYCEQYLHIDWPRCPITNERVGFTVSGAGIRCSRFKKGKISKTHSSAFAEACSKMSKNRRGENNPMFGKSAWNKGLDKTNPIVARMAKSLIGLKPSETTRKKMRERRLQHPLKARHTQPHSEKTKALLRKKTALLWASGRFNRQSSIHIKVRDYLSSLNLQCPLEEEWQVKYFSMDFALPEAKIAIECQGTYFHIDPRIYPTGPRDAIQRRNFGRDQAKKKYCKKLGWKIIEVWETEINDGSFKEYLKCELQKLNLLKI